MTITITGFRLKFVAEDPACLDDSSMIKFLIESASSSFAFPFSLKSNTQKTTNQDNLLTNYKNKAVEMWPKHAHTHAQKAKTNILLKSHNQTIKIQNGPNKKLLPTYLHTPNKSEVNISSSKTRESKIITKESWVVYIRLNLQPP